jgi:dTDP-4-dehydrorhamnose reductase
MDALELWGGLECTINRVGDRFGDQLDLNGHYRRADDIQLVADLGIRTLRYPLLWERIAPEHPDRCDWSWHDGQMEQFRARGMRVIAGLVHHGSGPHYTNLLDPGFAPGLARHAGEVARRYPWIEDWTPVNEPLTTARFSALYGHWYPHRRDEGAFWCAFVNQIDATRLAMREIRRVNPRARLIQTEDLGRTYATVAMREQAAFDNLRRWASWDMLCGRITPAHPLWRRIARFGLEDQLRAIAEDPCPPDVIGVNHYLTSDRFLDHRLYRYPAGLHGSNGLTRYADVDAIRVLDPAPLGLRGALQEAWDRYRIPIVVTEVHNGCTREEQLRWTAEAWDTAQALRTEGVRVDAVTSWSLLGSNGWNTLLTAPGIHEPGAYDLRGGGVRPTALTTLLRGLEAGLPRHPVASGQGWWHRPMRLLHAPVARPAGMREHIPQPARNAPAKPLLICGATGTLGQAFARACEHRNIDFVLTARSDLDLSDERSIAEALDRNAPWAVVNAAGWVRVDDAEGDPAGCFRANATGASTLARQCGNRGTATVSFSSDLVFDGEATSPYREGDPTRPLGAYGRSKAAMEEALLACPGAHLIVRTAAFFSPHDDHNFAKAVVGALSARREFAAASDQVVSPAYVPWLVNDTLDLLIDGETGIRHIASQDALSWADFARAIATAAGLDAKLVVDAPGETLGWVAPRPKYCALTTDHGEGLGPLEPAIRAFVETLAEAAAPRALAA